MFNIIGYMPLHLFYLMLSQLAPRWIFIATYKPSTEHLRQQETTLRNTARLLIYRLKVKGE